MKCLAMVLMMMVLMSGMLAAVSLECRAEQACAEVAVEGSVDAGPGELTLADLLTQDTCVQLRSEAARVSLGAAPQSGSVRILDGRAVRQQLEVLAGAVGSVGKTVGMSVPERIVVKRRGETKSCAEIASFVAGAATAEVMAKVPNRWREDLDCAAARGIPEETPLALAKSTWNRTLERWEFALGCARPGDCVPFLVWIHEPKTSVTGTAGSHSGAARPVDVSGETPARWRPAVSRAERLVAPGETATLTWDQAGIRVVLPVTCLDAGALGQFVRVQLKNAARILRAEVVGAGTLRASL
jgi:hypothetical protein